MVHHVSERNLSRFLRFFLPDLGEEVCSSSFLALLVIIPCDFVFGDLTAQSASGVHRAGKGKEDLQKTVQRIWNLREQPLQRPHELIIPDQPWM